MIQTANGSELTDKLSSGINKLVDAVGSTLGPMGRNVLINGDKVTKDGVTVARAFDELPDPVENIGMQMVKKVSEKAVDRVGDGTTTATVLTGALLTKGFEVINAGANNVEVKKGIDKAVKLVVANLKSLSEDIVTDEQIRQVATISGNNDAAIGNLIATALEKVGTDGVVYIEESKNGETSLESVEGMQFDRGLKSPYFVTDNVNMQAVLENPLILLSDDKIMTNKQILNALESAANANRSILIIADDIEGEALPTLIVNKARGIIKVAAVKAPDFGERKLAVLEDIAILTGGTVISSKKGMNLEKIPVTDFSKYFGEARMVTSDAKETTIIDGKGSVDAIKERLDELKTQLSKAKSQFETEIFQDRLSKLAGGVAIIKVGGLSEIEMKEKKDRVDDALHATKAALEEGIVPGGGMALVNSLWVLENVEEGVFENIDQDKGREIVKEALLAPFRTILKNAGVTDPDDVLFNIYGVPEEPESRWTIFGISLLGLEKPSDKLFEQADIWNGYNVKTGEYVNLKDAGILDPKKVTRTALEQAASVAGTILTTHTAVYNLPENVKPAMHSNDDLSNFM